jgi:hypothetical protein
MPIMLNSILQECGLDLKNVLLLRHQDNRAAKGLSPYTLWRDDRLLFEEYQSYQKVRSESRFRRSIWVSFVVTSRDETLLAGIYRAKGKKLLAQDVPRTLSDGVQKAGEYHVYDLTLEDFCRDLIGRMVIDWGAGKRSWTQLADNQNKHILEIRSEFKEPDFPGFMNFIEPLSQLAKLPQSWVTALQSAKGIYLLTCPRTREQYVGSATGESGFWQRWQDYARSGHGGNVALESRDLSDYQVSVLEVAGTANTADDILKMEKRWKQKLQSQDMGLNRN